MTTTNVTSVAVKPSSKPVSTIKTKALNTRKKSKATELSKELWRDKSNGKSPQLLWKIVTRNTLHQPGTRAGMLCLAEKYAILQACSTTSLYRRTKLMGKCRHTDKFKSKIFRNHQCLLFFDSGLHKSSAFSNLPLPRIFSSRTTSDLIIILCFSDTWH